MVRTKVLPSRKRDRKKMEEEMKEAANNLIAYIQYLVGREESFPKPVRGRPFECARCLMENLLETGEGLGVIATAELLMHGIRALRLPPAKSIEAWIKVAMK